MAEATQDFLKGHFLLAMPGLNDPNFHQTVTCISEHTTEGAVGIVINRVHPILSSGDIFKELNMGYPAEAAEFPVYIGGPVHMGELFILHSFPFNWKGCLKITPTLGMSNTMDILEAVASGHGPESFIISLGCAGWGPGQLEAEIKENVWLTGPIFEEIIFKQPVSSRWEEAAKHIGIDLRLLSDQAGHA